MTWNRSWWVDEMRPPLPPLQHRTCGAWSGGSLDDPLITHSSYMQ